MHRLGFVGFIGLDDKFATVAVDRCAIVCTRAKIVDIVNTISICIQFNNFNNLEHVRNSVAVFISATKETAGC